MSARAAADVVPGVVPLKGSVAVLAAQTAAGDARGSVAIHAPRKFLCTNCSFEAFWVWHKPGDSTADQLTCRRPSCGHSLFSKRAEDCLQGTANLVPRMCDHCSYQLFRVWIIPLKYDHIPVIRSLTCIRCFIPTTLVDGGSP